MALNGGKARMSPYHMVLEHMVSPIRDKLQNGQVTLDSMREYLACLESILSMISSENLDSQDVRALSLDFKESEALLLNIIKKVCFPILHSLHLLPESGKVEKNKAVSVVPRFIIACLHHVHDNDLSTTVTQMLMPLLVSIYKEDNILLKYKDSDYFNSETEPWDLCYCLDVVGFILSNPTIFMRYLTTVTCLGLEKENMLNLLSETILLSSHNDSAFCKAFVVLTKLLMYFPKSSLSACLDRVWRTFVHQSDQSSDKKDIWRSLYVFYCLKDWFFPLDQAGGDALSSRLVDSFWLIVQQGLVATEPAHRKLSMYLLKRLVDTCEKNKCVVNSSISASEEWRGHPAIAHQNPIFWWCPKSSALLSCVWEDFILIIEMLEEKQVHVIKPVLSRMSKLISACSKSSEKGQCYLHSSWLMTIIARCFHHESYYMSRWGANILLTLDFKQVPLIAHGQLKFLSQDLLGYLQENKLYSRYDGTELGKSSPVGVAMKDYFARLFLVLNKQQKGEYLQNVLKTVCDNNWGSIPLVFVFQGLSCIDPDPIINSEILRLIRYVLRAFLINHEAVTRGATQCFICRTLLNLFDGDSVSWPEFFNTLAALNREESLQRGKSLWGDIVLWLGSATIRNKWSQDEILQMAMEFLKGSGKDVDESVNFEGYKVTGLTRALLLTADVLEGSKGTHPGHQSDVDSNSQDGTKSALAQVLTTISDTIVSLRNRPYINISYVDRCLAVLLSLAKECGALTECCVDVLLKNQLVCAFKGAVNFVKTRLSSISNETFNLDEIKSYCDVLLSLGQLSEVALPQLPELVIFSCNMWTSVAKTGQNKSTTHFDVLSTTALGLLATVFKIMSSHSSKESWSATSPPITELLQNIFDLPLPFRRRNQIEQSVSNADAGRVVGCFISSKWQCLKHLLRLQMDSEKWGVTDLEKLKEQAMEDLSIGSGISDRDIFLALEVVMPKLASHNPGSLLPLMELAYSKVMEEGNNSMFWRKLEALIPLVLHKSIFQDFEDSNTGYSASVLLQKLTQLGMEKNGVMFLVLSHLCGTVLVGDVDRKLAKRLLPILVEGCSFGTLHKKGERLWLDVCAYIESLGNSCSVNEITSSMSKNDLFSRIIVLNWLSKLNPQVSADHEFTMHFVWSLKAVYLELALQTTFKQFSNCLSHRKKHRMVLTLLMLCDFITEDDCGELLSFLWHALEIECHPSVRQSLEWMVMKLISRFPDYVSTIWSCFPQYKDKRSVCLCSIFLIIAHIGTKLPNTMKFDFYNQAFLLVMPWCMAHHYNTRIFAQTTVVKLWDQCKASELTDVINKFLVVESTVDFLFQNCNASDTALKLLKNYMFSAFDPIKDYSMESVFHTLPRLACIADDEWILPRQLMQWDSSWETCRTHLLPLRNSSDTLAQCADGPWRMKAHAENDVSITESADGDIQKKIMPWRQMLPDQETENELASQRYMRSKDGLVLVTSLIEKVPNLGGLCRTSEIFGVSEFVIGNLIHLNDRMFQSLSVSAQKWVNITEVLRPRLTEFLEEKRLCGYTLVGVEQTANSVPLDKFYFPKKTLLLLGNEKEGIPVDIIQLLDACVEIPQLGVIRSLNVHVCGALIVWEYTRQHMRQAETTGQDTRAQPTS